MVVYGTKAKALTGASDAIKYKRVICVLLNIFMGSSHRNLQ